MLGPMPDPGRDAGAGRAGPRGGGGARARGGPPLAGAAAAGALALACLAAYGNSFQAAFQFDDAANIVRNPTLRWTELSLANLLAVVRGSPNWRPVANLSFALNHYLWGTRVEAYHAVNLLVHFANGLLVYALARAAYARLAERPEPGGVPAAPRARDALALLAALLFALHPLQTQAVTFVVQRMTSLATLFYLSALGLALRGLRGPSRAGSLALALLCGLLALGSKQFAVTLPYAIWLTLVCFERERSRALARRAHWILAAWTVALLGAWLLIFWGPEWGYRKRDFDLGERLLTQLRVVSFYLSLIAWPAPGRLSVDHAFAPSRGLLDPPSTLASLILLAALLGLALAAARRRQLAGFGLLWLFLHLAPESSILPLEMAHEHRNYLPLVGPCLAAPPLVSHALRRLRAGWWLSLAAALLPLVALGAATHVRNRAWRDGESLWSDALAKNPGSTRALHNLGVALADQGRHEEAIARFAQALRLDPGLSAAHRGIGASELRRGRPEAALPHLLEAVRLRPGDAQAQGILGEAQLALGRLDLASEALTRSLALVPDEVYYHQLAKVRSLQGRPDEALHYYTRALEVSPGFPRALLERGALLAAQGRHAEASADFSALLDRFDDPLTRVHLGNALLAMGRCNEALVQLSRAHRMAPRSAFAARSLAWLLATCDDAALRDPERAIALLEELLLRRAAPEAGLLDALAAGLAAAARFEEASALAAEAARLARGEGQRELADEIEARAALYRAGQPYRIPSRARAG
jgi:tetratricopeptide (TPR) repeat protein